MHAYAIDPARIVTNEDIGYGLDLIRKTLDIFGPRELVVIDEYTKEVKGCLTWQGLVKADKKDKFYVRKAESYRKKILTVSSMLLKKEKELTKKMWEAADKNRSLFMLRKGVNPKKLFLGKIFVELPSKGISEILLGIEYSDQNCPYTYKLKVEK